MAVFNGTAGVNNFVGAGGVADTFNFLPAHLSAADTVIGGSGAGIFDTLRFTNAGTVAAAALANVSGIERIQLSTVGNALTLTLGLQTSALARTIEIRGGAGGDTVLGANTVDPTLSLDFLTGTNSSDSFTGGAGRDSVLVQGAGSLFVNLLGGDDVVRSSVADLNAADTLLGGLGADALVFTTAGAITAGNLARVEGFEEIRLAGGAGSSISLTNAVLEANGGVLTIISGADSSRVDASAVTTGRVLFVAGTGADTVLGGAGNDTVEAAAAVSGSLNNGRDTLRLLNGAAATSTLNGGGSFDTIEIVAPGAFNLNTLTLFERVTRALNSAVLLPGTTGMELIGSDLNDAVTLGGAQQTVLGMDGNDVVTVDIRNSAGLVLDGGDHSTRDLLLLRGAGTWNFRSDGFVTGFERIVFDDSTAGSVITLGFQAADVHLSAAARVTMGLAPTQKVVGSAGNDSITVGAAGQIVLAGGGNDSVQATAAQLLGGALVTGGNGVGFDSLVVAGGGTLDLLDVTATGFEGVALSQATTLLSASRAVSVSGSAGGDSITLRDAGSVALGEAGQDTLRAAAAGVTLDGGAGSDGILFLPGDQPFWNGAPLTLIGGTTPANIDQIVVDTSAGAPVLLDLTRHSVTGIDRVLVTGPGQADVMVTLNDAVVATADAYGFAREFGIESDIVMLGDVTVMAGSLSAANDVLFGFDSPDRFGGNDLVMGGAGADVARGADGADTLLGGAGNDELTGGAGNDSVAGGNARDLLTGDAGADTISTSAGEDSVTGGTGGDLLLFGGVSPGAALFYTSLNDGTADIDTTRPEADADRVTGYDPSQAFLVLDAAGLGLSNGGVVSVGANLTWNVGSGAVFIFESDSLNADTIEADDFGSFAAVDFALDFDSGGGFGSSVGRRVGLVISNNETTATRRTGLYVWQDNNGDGRLDVPDFLVLLAVFDGVRANQFSSANVIFD